MDESFPIAEAAFRDAFTQPDPAPKLLELIKAHPSGAAIVDLVSVYFQLAAEDPTQLPRYAEALTIIQKTQEPTINAADQFGNPAERNIAPVLDMALAGFHGGDLAVVKDTSIVPSNDYLVGSLLSAVSLRYRLTDSPAQVGGIRHGLHYRDDCYVDVRATRKVLVLGSCLQLLVAGSYLYGPGGTDVGKDDISAALEAVKADRVVKTPNGQQLLEYTIQHAKSGF